MIWLKKNDFYGIESLNEETIKFSVLSTALADEIIGLYTGVTSKNENSEISYNNIIEHPENIKHEEVKNLILWLFKPDENGKTRVGDSRNIRLLSKVLNNTRALKAFQDGATLQQAYQFTADLKNDFLEIIYEILSKSQAAAGMVANIDYSQDATDILLDARRNLQMIHKTLESKRCSTGDVEDV